MSLSSQKCVACRVGEPKLTAKEIQNYQQEVVGWQLKMDPDRLVKEFEFEDFKSALNFVNRVGELAEDQGHHPNIRLYDFKKIELELYTHKIGGLHKNDFILAAKVDDLKFA